MKKTAKVISFILALTFIVAQFGVATSAKATKAEKVKLKVAFFKGGFGEEWFKWLEAEYEKANPNIDILLEGDANLNTTLPAKIQGGTDAPDVFFANKGANDWKKWGPMGLVLEISDVYDSKVPGTNTTLNNFVQQATKANFFYNPTRKGIKKYAVPWSSGSFSIVYNAKMFKQNGWVYPKTWAEFAKLCEKIKAKGIAPLTYPGIYPNYAKGLYRAWQYEALGDKKYAEYKNPLSDDIYKNVGLLMVWNKWQSLFKNGWIMNGTTALTHTQAQMEFINNKAAMILNGPWLENEMKDAWPAGYDIRMAPVPADGYAKKPVTLLYFPDYAAIYGKTQYPKEAKKFLLFSCSQQASQKFTELTGSFRPYNYDLSKVKLTAFGRSCVETLNEKNNIVINEVSSNPLFFGNIGTDYLTKIATNSMTPQQALLAFYKEAVAFMDKTKKSLKIK